SSIRFSIIRWSFRQARHVCRIFDPHYRGELERTGFPAPPRESGTALIYIIGSGLSGIAAAVALVRRGYRPTILDAGIKADPETSDLKARLRSVEPDAWTQVDLAQLKQMGPAASTGIPRKLHFGS